MLKINPHLTVQSDRSSKADWATAREKVRVAQALKRLPEISAAFSTGELSYSKVRSLTRVADAGNEEDLVTMLKEYLQGNGGETNSNSDNYLVNIHVDQSALAGDVGRSSVPIETVKRLCCDGHTVVMTETKDGEPLSIGRKSRVVPKAIERAGGGLLSAVEKLVNEPPPPQYFH